MMGCGVNLLAPASSTALFCLLRDLRVAPEALVKDADAPKQRPMHTFIHSAVLCDQTPFFNLYSVQPLR